MAAYVSMGTEPGTGALLDALDDAGKRVILPLLQPDNDLDWALHTGPGDLVSAGRGLLEPVGRRLGVDAVAGADVVLVPGLAVAVDGTRMGRGGGSYDRALARVPVGTFTCIAAVRRRAGRRGPARAARPRRPGRRHPVRHPSLPIVREVVARNPCDFEPFPLGLSRRGVSRRGRG